jgi:hypothetical protein
MRWLDEGAYTGETSAIILPALGCTRVLIGHSERRRYFNETDETVNRNLLSALAHGLIPVVCVSETTGERAAGATAAVLQRQVSAAPRTSIPRLRARSSSLTSRSGDRGWFAGHPLGHGDAHTRTRANVASVLGTDNAQRTRILYGGSVDPQNAASPWALAESMGRLPAAPASTRGRSLRSSARPGCERRRRVSIPRLWDCKSVITLAIKKDRQNRDVVEISRRLFKYVLDDKPRRVRSLGLDCIA